MSRVLGQYMTVKKFNNVPYVDSIVVWNDEDGELVFFAVNRVKIINRKCHFNCRILK